MCTPKVQSPITATLFHLLCFISILTSENQSLLPKTHNSRERERERVRCQAQKPPKNMRIIQEQMTKLECSFEESSKLDFERKRGLAYELSLDPRQVEVWFQNRRARWKSLGRTICQVKDGAQLHCRREVPP